MFSCKVHHLRHFCFGDLVSEDTALADAVMMHMQHDSRSSLAVLVEEPLQHMHHEFHRRVIVIEDEDAVKVRPFGLRLGLGDDGGAGAAGVPALAVVVRRGRCKGPPRRRI